VTERVTLINKDLSDAISSVQPTVGRLRRGTKVHGAAVSRPSMPLVNDATSTRTMQRLWPYISELRDADHPYRIDEDKLLPLCWVDRVDSTNCWIAKTVRPFLGRLLRVDLIKWVSNVRPSVRTYVRTYVRPQKSFFDFNEIWM